ncbi:MAG TPA: hypothetical protein VEI99_02770 [Terriglobales bacterium]|nr:hypothetical protein [Terriglobales bacterium]
MAVMFEQELELEKKQSSAVPLLLIVAMIAALVGVAGYYIRESRKVLGMYEASSLAMAALDTQGPALIRFHTGFLAPSLKPQDPNYRLLEKAGLLKLGKEKGRTTPVTLTPAGEKQLAEIAGVEKTTENDGTVSYVVPIAERRLLGVNRITMIDLGHATVEFTWKWEPNRLGDLFDISGPLVKSFNTWERAALIGDYAANFYHGDAKQAVISVVKSGPVWKLPEQ